MTSTKSATAWMLTGHFVSILLKMTGNLVLTRLLAPEAFGLMAIANVVLLGIALMTDVGLKQNVIRHESVPDREYLDTIWSLQVIKGILISAVILIIAFILQETHKTLPGVYSNSELPIIIALLALNPFICGFESTKVAVSSRNLSIALISRIEIYSQALGLYCSLSMALNGFGVMSLAIGPLTAILIRTIMGALFLPGESNRFRINKKHAFEIINFGKWVFLASALSFITNYGDQLILGGLIDTTTMADFAIAFFILGIIRQVSTKFSFDIGLPKLSKAYRDDSSDLKKAYYKTRLPIDFYALFTSGFIFYAGQTIIDILYDSRYAGTGAILSVLALAISMDRYLMLPPFLLAIGKPKTNTYTTALRSINLIAALPASYLIFGIEGATLFLACYKFIEIPIILKIQKNLDILDIKKEISSLTFWPAGLFIGYVFSNMINHLMPYLST